MKTYIAFVVTNTGKLIGVAHTNQEAVEKAKKLGEPVFVKIKTGRLWRKGIKDGQRMFIEDIQISIDNNIILYVVYQTNISLLSDFCKLDPSRFSSIWEEPTTSHAQYALF